MAFLTMATYFTGFWKPFYNKQVKRASALLIARNATANYAFIVFVPFKEIQNAMKC